MIPFQHVDFAYRSRWLPTVRFILNILLNLCTRFRIRWNPPPIGIVAGGDSYGLSVLAVLPICWRIPADSLVGYADAIEDCQISLRSAGCTRSPHLSPGVGTTPLDDTTHLQS